MELEEQAYCSGVDLHLVDQRLDQSATLEDGETYRSSSATVGSVRWGRGTHRQMVGQAEELQDWGMLEGSIDLGSDEHRIPHVQREQ